MSDSLAWDQSDATVGGSELRRENRCNDAMCDEDTDHEVNELALRCHNRNVSQTFSRIYLRRDDSIVDLRSYSPRVADNATSGM